jgi:hypothetical protein
MVANEQKTIGLSVFGGNQDAGWRLVASPV